MRRDKAGEADLIREEKSGERKQNRTAGFVVRAGGWLGGMVHGYVNGGQDRATSGAEARAVAGHTDEKLVFCRDEHLAMVMPRAWRD